MRQILGIILVFLVGLALFWVGLVQHFPGDTLARYLEEQANRDPRVSVSVSPVELDWTELWIERVGLRGQVSGLEGPWVAFLDTRIPLSFDLMRAAEASSRVGTGGRVALTWRGAEQTVTIDARDIPLEQIPALRALPTGAISGRLRVSGTVSTGGQLPEGQLAVRVEDMTVGAFSLQGLQVPETRIQEASGALELGPVIEVRELQVRGDVTGQVTGTVRPNPRALPLSRVDLQMDLAAGPEWISAWGDLAPILEGFLDSGRLAGRVTGTVARPNFRQSRSLL